MNNMFVPSVQYARNERRGGQFDPGPEQVALGAGEPERRFARLEKSFDTAGDILDEPASS